MRPSPMCECVTVTPDVSLARVWQASSTVLYLRVSDHEGELPAPPGNFRQTADVLEVLKGYSGPTATFLEYQGTGYPNSGTEPPHDVGEELVMFVPSANSDGNAMLFIREGRVHAAPDYLGRYVGVSLNDVLSELLALARAQ
jgi:hypothetical protein